LRNDSIVDDSSLLTHGCGDNYGACGYDFVVLRRFEIKGRVAVLWPHGRDLAAEGDRLQNLVPLVRYSG